MRWKDSFRAKALSPANTPFGVLKNVEGYITIF